MLEPDDGKPSSPVLRGLGASNGARLLDPNLVVEGYLVIRPRSATCGIEFQLSVQSQVKDERQVWPEIHLLFSPVAIKFNFE